MNTRKLDLEIIDHSRELAKSEEGKRHKDALLALIYEQSKDSVLESMRIKLMDAFRRNDTAEIAELEKKIKKYANTPAFKKKMAESVARQVGQDQAIKVFKKVKF